MSIVHPLPSAILGSARLHVDTAIALVGRDQVLAWISASPPQSTLNATSDVSVARSVSTTTTIRKTASCDTIKHVTTGTRGRKSGIIPPTDQRCSWTLTSGEQCANKKKGDNALCGLHIGKVHLVDTIATTSVVKKSDNHISLIYDSVSDESDESDASDDDAYDV